MRVNDIPLYFTEISPEPKKLRRVLGHAPLWHLRPAVLKDDVEVDDTCMKLVASQVRSLRHRVQRDEIVPMGPLHVIVDRKSVGRSLFRVTLHAVGGLAPLRALAEMADESGLISPFARVPVLLYTRRTPRVLAKTMAKFPIPTSPIAVAA